jgi:hypothetical protein
MAIQPRSENDLRGLKALVGILGVLIILGTALVIGVVIHRIYGKPAAATPGTIQGASVALAPSSLLARGEHISGIAGAGGELAIWVTGPAGDKVLLLDPATGKIGLAISTPP